MNEYEKKKQEFIMTLLFGWLGIHKFMNDEPIVGFTYMATLGLFFVGWFIDIIKTGKELYIIIKEGTVEKQELNDEIQNNVISQNTHNNEDDDKIYRDLVSQTKIISYELMKFYDDDLVEIGYENLLQKIREFKEKIQEIVEASKKISISDYEVKLNEIINEIKTTIDRTFIIFHTKSMQQFYRWTLKIQKNY